MGDDSIPMKPASSEQVVFAKALECATPEARAAYLAGACGMDTALRGRVEALLRAAENAGDFLEEPPTGLAPGDASTMVVTGFNEKPGDRIGRYKLLQQIGEGGCGVVYMAEQEEPVRRRVALKVIKLGMDTKSVIARFEAERQALALMDHPNIAKVFDAGATDTGRPYFVMELVRGIKITDYCDQNNLSTEERLKLFTQVCQAIQHAHQKGIIHRDIKPSNILVTVSEPGSPGCPKVIDFGIAKATTGQRLTDKTVFTAFEQFIGTPAYMSPEQAMMTSLDIDTRTDIYALGVLLYELLTGQTPFDAEDLMAAGLDAMRRIIREKEPARPSTRLSTLLAADLTIVASHRHSEPARLGPLLRGDLDWIVMKALEKDRSRRYETANALAMDIQRHLDDEPVVARPPSKHYRFQKLVRRNKLAFGAAGAVVAALVIGLGVSTWMFFKAQGEKKKTQTEAAKATAISDFLQELLSSANPEALKSSEYTVRQLLDDFSAGLGTRLAGQPEVEATVRATIGHAYLQLGLADKAEPHLERALALRSRIFGERSQEVAQSLVDRAWNLSEQARLAEAEAEIKRALDIYRTSGADAQPLIHARYALGVILNLQKRFKESETISEEALALARNSPNRDFPDMANLIHNLADTKVSQAKYVEAENLALQAGEMHRRLRGAEHPDTAWSLVILGRALAGQHRLAEAERAYQEALAIFRRYYAFEHKTVQLVVLDLRAVLEAEGDLAAVETLYREALAGQRATLGNDSAAVAETLSGLAASLYAQGKPAEAEKASREAMEIVPKLRNQDLAKLPPILRPLAEVLKSQGKALDAERLYEEAIKAARQMLGESHPALGEMLHDYGEFLLHETKWEKAAEQYIKSLPIRRAKQDENLAWTLRNLGYDLLRAARPKEAESYLRESLTLYRKLHEQENFNGTAWTGESLADALFQQHKLLEAEQGYREALLAYSKTQGVGGDEYARVVQSLFQVLKAENKLVDDEALCREVLAEQRAAFTNDNPAVAQTLRTLADNLVSQGKPAEAEPLFREAIAIYEKVITNFPNNAALKSQLVDLLRAQGKLGEAEPVLREALARQRILVGSEHLDVATSLSSLSFLLRDEGKLPEAETTAREALAIRKRLLSNEHADVALSLHQLAWNLHMQGKQNEAEALSREEVAMWRKLLGNEHPNVAWALGDLTLFLRDQKKLPEAVTTAREALAMRRKLLGNEHADVAQSLHVLAWNLHMQGKQNEAEALSREEVAMWRKLLGNEHPNVAWALGDLTLFLRDQKKLPEAETTIRESLAIRRKVFGNEHPDVAASFNLLSDLLRAQSKLAELETLYREELALRRKQFGNQHRSVEQSLARLAQVLQQEGKLAEAEAVWREELAMERKLSGDEHPFVANSLTSLARVLQDQDKLAEAEAAYREALALRRKLPADDSQLAAALAGLTRTLLAAQKFAESEPPARECLTLHEKVLPGNWLTFSARSMLGNSLLGKKQYAEAEPLLLSGYEGMKQREDKIPASSKRYVKEALQHLVQLYEATGQSEKAAEWNKTLADLDPTETEKNAAVPRP